MRLTLLSCMFLVALAALAQDDHGTVSKVESITYPPLPLLARIHGEVRLSSGPEGVKVVSGHPLLKPVAVDSLEGLGKVWPTQVEVVYHFVLIDGNRITRKTVRRATPSTG